MQIVLEIGRDFNIDQGDDSLEMGVLGTDIGGYGGGGGSGVEGMYV